MKWLTWCKSIFRRKPAARSLTQCPDCGREMTMVEKFTMSGDDRRTYRCKRCGKEHILDFGTALWKRLSDARKSASDPP